MSEPAKPLARSSHENSIERTPTTGCISDCRAHSLEAISGWRRHPTPSSPRTRDGGNNTRGRERHPPDCWGERALAVRSDRVATHAAHQRLEQSFENPLGKPQPQQPDEAHLDQEASRDARGDRRPTTWPAQGTSRARRQIGRLPRGIRGARGQENSAGRQGGDGHRAAPARSGQATGWSGPRRRQAATARSRLTRTRAALSRAGAVPGRRRCAAVPGIFRAATNSATPSTARSTPVRISAARRLRISTPLPQPRLLLQDPHFLEGRAEESGHPRDLRLGLLHPHGDRLVAPLLLGLDVLGVLADLQRMPSPACARSGPACRQARATPRYEPVVTSTPCSRSVGTLGRNSDRFCDAMPSTLTRSPNETASEETVMATSMWPPRSAVIMGACR